MSFTDPSPKAPSALQDEHFLRGLFEDYLRMYSGRDDTLTTRFSRSFSGFTGGGDFLVKDTAEWIAITRLDFSQVKEPIRIELKDVSLQSLSESVAVATGFFSIHLPIKDDVLSRETARLVLIFRRESEEWMISHSSISIPYHGVGKGEVYPLKDLEERNRFLEEQVLARTAEVSEANAKLLCTNEVLAREMAEREQSALQLQSLLSRRTLELREATATALRADADAEDRIGQELHDTLCPDLIGLARQAEGLSHQEGLSAEIKERLRGLADQASAASRRSRNISHLLARPDMVNVNFADLLRAQLHHLELALGLACDLTIDELFPHFAPEPSDHLIRIVREAVGNAARHGGAARVWVDCVMRGERAVLSISNDGSPLPPPESLRPGIGLRQMRMRADQLDAAFNLKPGNGGGAVVELSFVPSPEFLSTETPP